MGRPSRSSARRGLLATVVVVAALAASGAACNEPVGLPGPPGPADPTPPSPTLLETQVLAEHPHDASAYTQGLEILAGRLYESTGQRGRSSLREVDLASGEVLRKVELERPLFGEGIAIVGDRIIQLTWQERTALVYELATFEQIGSFAYEGEGWGLCYDGTGLIMSDGTDRLYRRDPDSFEVLSEVRVTRGGVPLRNLNELECVDGMVWANVYLTDEIVQVDPASGNVRATVDASGLPGSVEASGVLNGIAYDEEDGTFLVTGKNWPTLFRVAFVASHDDQEP